MDETSVEKIAKPEPRVNEGDTLREEPSRFHAPSFLERALTSPRVTKLAGGLFSFLTLGGHAAQVHAQADINQATADAFSSGNSSNIQKYLDQGMPSQKPLEQQVDEIKKIQEQQLGAEQLVTNYILEDLRSGGDSAVGLIKLPDGKHIVVPEWDAATSTFKLRDKGKPSIFALTAIQSPVDLNIQAAVGRRGENDNVGALWLAGTAYENKGKTIFDAQFDPTGQFIITTEEGLSESGVVHSKFDLENKQFTPLKVASGEVFRIQSSLRNTSDVGVYKTYGIDPLRWGYKEITVDTNNDTITTRHLYEEVGYVRGRLVPFVRNGVEKVWTINNDTQVPSRPNSIFGTLFETGIGDPVTIRVKEGPELGSNSVGIQAAALDLVGGLGYMGFTTRDIDNIATRYIEIFDLDDPTNMEKRQRVSLPGNSRGDTFTSMQVLTQGSERYLLVGLKSSVSSVDNGVWIYKITGGSGNLRKAAVALQPIFRISLPVLTKNNATGW